MVCKSLAIAIINSFSKGMFPDIAKKACVSPLDKHTHNKYCVTYFRPVSILNNFSKTYEKIVKDFLISKM